MIAYLFWHRAYPTTTVEQYEEALMRFQQRLGQQQPPGFGGSASFRVAALPWLGNRPGYEDWCLLDGSWALDRVDIFHLHNAITEAGGGEALSVQQVLGEGAGISAAAAAGQEFAFSALPLSAPRRRFIE